MHCGWVYLPGLGVSRNLRRVFRSIRWGMLLVWIGVLGCGDDAPQLDVRVIDRDGRNPLTGSDANTIDFRVLQESFSVVEESTPVVDGGFEAAIQLASSVAPTELQVEIADEGAGRLGATPVFVPEQVGDTIRILVGMPSSCAVTTRPTMAAARADAGTSRVSHFLVVAGGTAEQARQIEVLDLVSLSRLDLTGTPDVVLGPTQLVELSLGRALVLSELAAPFILSTSDPDERAVSVSLHAGAQRGGTAVPFLEGQVWVVGGLVGDAPQPSVSIVGVDNVAPNLTTPRQRPVVVPIGDRLLVVGGDTAGTAELLDASAATLVPGVQDGVRRDPIFVTDGSSLLIMGGLDAEGEVRQDTLLWTGCPSACAASAGPDWTTAREGAATHTGARFVVGGVDSVLVEEVVFSRVGAEIRTAYELAFPRARASLDVLRSGVLVVVGGESTEGPRTDLEYCFPQALTAP